MKDIDFEANDALAKLERFGLAKKDNGSYRVIPLRDAITQLDAVWQRGNESTDDY